MIISPTGLIAQVSPNGLTLAGGMASAPQRHGDARCGTAPSPPRSGWEGSLKLANEAFSRGQMRVEARHPAGEWLPLSPAAPLPAPQTHYQWRWTPLNVAIDIRLPLASAPVRLRAASWRNTASFTIRTPLHD